jgi:exodeoxyribonuclease V beta subunit
LTRARGRVILPLLAEEELRTMEGSAYAGVNRRLADLFSRGLPDPLFEVREIELEPAVPPPPAGSRVTPASLAEPDEPDLAPERRELRELAHRHRALRMTSYSRIKRAHGGYVAPVDADALKGETAPPPDPMALPEVEPETLPGGVAMGILLHEIIEELPLATLAGPPAVDAWAADPGVRALLDAKLARHGMDPLLRPAIERLLHRSLTAPLRVGETMLAGLASVPASAREMEFVFPYPESAHPALAELLGQPLDVERGYVQGVIDLVFELEGRFYFADWKTDILPDYADAAVRLHVERNYRLQAQLYALAIVKMLSIRDREAYDVRFGRLLYCFLRGMRMAAGGSSPGVYFERPGWDELVALDAQLRTGGDFA